MAIAEMSKLNLIAMSYERDKILNALHRTGATEIKTQAEKENTVPLSADGADLREYLSRIEGALEILSRRTERYVKENKIKTDVLKDGFTVSYAEFMSCKDYGGEADILVAEIYSLADRLKSLETERAKLTSERVTAKSYACINEPLSAYSDTAFTEIKLGTVPADKTELLSSLGGDGSLSAYSVLNISGDSALVLVAGHKSLSGVAEILSGAGFTPCPYTDGRSGEQVLADIDARILEIDGEYAAADDRLCKLQSEIKKLKTYADFVAFELEKADLAEKMRATETTVLMEAYVPKEAQESVAGALDSASGAVYYGFSEPTDTDTPPTLYKNNKVVKNFETITNMYSPVSYREFDPNAVMGLFYSIFLGFIMADIGYGLLMLIGGGFIYMKQKRDTGLKRLAGVFAAGGIFAIVWGVLFNSLFGTDVLLPFTIMPDAKDGRWHLAGIEVPAVLVISLIIGVVQLGAGYACLAVQNWRRGKVADGILDGFVWTLFSLGAALAIVGFITEAGVPVLAYVGGICAGVCLVVAMLTAGRKEKLLGKFTKGFGAAYGIINYASDILSYARLYGLMLSGAVIAQIVSDYSIQFITGGNIALAILGVVLMVVGHGFNLAIGLLGAYIHDARLQYVEFYGKFYEGEGELFAPLGSKQAHTYLVLGE